MASDGTKFAGVDQTDFLFGRLCWSGLFILLLLEAFSRHSLSTVLVSTDSRQLILHKAESFIILSNTPYQLERETRGVLVV